MATVFLPPRAPAARAVVPCFQPTSPVWPRRVFSLRLVLMALTLLWLTWTEYAFPFGCQAMWWGINPLASPHWAQHLHLRLPTALPPARWNRQFRAAIVLLWLGYGLLAYGARRALPSLRVVLTTTAFFAFTLAAFSPPLLATDAYAYAASGRLFVLYGQNPYFTLPYSFLHHAGDPAQFFLSWNAPTVYGPVWTGLVVGVVAALPHAWLWGEVLCLKLVEAGALCLLAWSAARIAEHVQPGRGRLAALLVGLCPLLLLEGPGSGHNDLLMMACLLTAIALFLQGRHGWAGLWLGLAVGIKVLPLALLPWLLWDLTRTLPDWPARRRAMLSLAGAMLLPLALGYACFWHGGAAWNALRGRTQSGGGTLLWAGIAYAVLSLWQWKAQMPPLWQCKQTQASLPWLWAWAVFSAVFMMTGLGYAFPWYIAWFWPVLALRGGRGHQALFAAVFVFALVWESLYATLLPAGALAGR